MIFQSLIQWAIQKRFPGSVFRIAFFRDLILFVGLERSRLSAFRSAVRLACFRFPPFRLAFFRFRFSAFRIPFYRFRI